MTRTDLEQAVARAIDATDEAPHMIDCPRCKGRGYHHGFGEDGNDPDWCEQCGGPGTIQDPMQRARAALSAIEEAGWVLVEMPKERPMRSRLGPGET